MSTVIKQIILESVDFRFDPDSEQLELLVTPQDLEFLVEMVVRECVSIAKSWEDQLEEADSLDESNAVGIVAYRIARQFGVSV